MSAIFAQVLRRNIGTSAIRFGEAATAGSQTGGSKKWKRLTFFVAFPCIGLCMLNAFLAQREHTDPPRSEFVKYDYMAKRDKRFPWGDGNKTLFHNPRVNALPDGYED